MGISSLRCIDCPAEFQSKRNDAKRCHVCRRKALARQTKASAERHRQARTDRAREAARKKAKSEKDAIRVKVERFRERYKTDPAFREQRRALARDEYANGGFVRNAQKRQAYAREYYAKNKGELNRKRVMAKQALVYRKDACELCGNEDPRVLCVHHKTPLAKGGTNDESNLQTLCANCHKIVHFEMGAG